MALYKLSSRSLLFVCLIISPTIAKPTHFTPQLEDPRSHPMIEDQYDDFGHSRVRTTSNESSNSHKNRPKPEVTELEPQILEENYQTKWAEFEGKIKNSDKKSKAYNKLIKNQAQYMVEYEMKLLNLQTQTKTEKLPQSTTNDESELRNEKLVQRQRKRSAKEKAFQDAIEKANKYPALKSHIELMKKNYFEKWDAQTSSILSLSRPIESISNSYSSVLNSVSSSSESNRSGDQEGLLNNLL